MKYTLIKNARIIDDGNDFFADVLIRSGLIERIDSGITIAQRHNYDEINAEGLLLIPGMIDAHVHFREPGLSYKGDMYSESAAALSGGVTSIMDMPNKIPPVLNLETLNKNFSIAEKKCLTNYSFFMGLSKDNLDEVLKLNTEDICGLTDDGLYFNDAFPTLCNSLDYVEKLFSTSDHLIALHSEDDRIIHENYLHAKQEFNEFIPPHYHTIIRSSTACYSSTKELISIAKKHNTRFHLLHVSTADELNLLDNHVPVKEKSITAETTIHHLYFNTDDYMRLGNLIKWNPSIKTNEDNLALLNGLHDNRIDIVATDHAPHLISEKIGLYDSVKPGGPMIQHALLAMFELYFSGKLTLQEVVKKTSNDVASVFRIKNRGFIREGYWADLVLINLNQSFTVGESNILYKCKWSPFLGHRFNASIDTVFLNGYKVFTQFMFDPTVHSMRLQFEKTR